MQAGREWRNGRMVDCTDLPPQIQQQMKRFGPKYLPTEIKNTSALAEEIDAAAVAKVYRENIHELRVNHFRAKMRQLHIKVFGQYHYGVSRWAGPSAERSDVRTSVTIDGVTLTRLQVENAYKELNTPEVQTFKVGDVVKAGRFNVYRGLVISEMAGRAIAKANDYTYVETDVYVCVTVGPSIGRIYRFSNGHVSRA